MAGQNQSLSFIWGAQQKPTFCLFRLYCPKAERVDAVLFNRYDQRNGEYHPMEKLDDGNWHLKLPGRHVGKYYAYRIQHPGDAEGLLHTESLIADPYSRQIATSNHYRQYARTRIDEPEPFNWQGDSFVIPPEQRDLIIYETHLRDMTAHPSAGAQSPGTYNGMIERNITGGISHLKKLGVNAVEFLPLQKFAGFEPPFCQKTPEGFHNTWNAYSRNHWGYMTSYFFAPETMYASDGSTKAGTVTGTSDRAATELKQLVRELHREGIAVIMDVVYNHVSQYDLNPLKYLDRTDFFRTDEDGKLTSESGCGNDLRTESPYIRELIISSVLWWMQEYHIDGFRFDLANLIDRETIAEIRSEAEKINPNVLLIAEPWGGGYDPTGFSAYGWSSWNDQLRNGVKGINPVETPGFIFGQWHYESSRESLENFIKGTLIHEPNGRFHHQEHAINYLEAHDGYTLGDFIRIALDPAKRNKKFNKKTKLIPLNEREMKTARLAALFLMTSQGIPMLHAGQEWGRSKWIVPDNDDDPDRGKLDHNSYEKDNETNYLDYTEIEANQSLFEYYRDLIRIRRHYPQLRLAEAGDITFHEYEDPLLLTFEIYSEELPTNDHLLVTLNGNSETDHQLTLPEGRWEIIADGLRVYPEEAAAVKNNPLTIPATSGMILRKIPE